MDEIGAEKGWQVDDTTDSRAFNSKNLAQYDVIVWNNTEGKVLDQQGRRAFEDFIHSGGGYVGIHAASNAEPDWEWYGDLVGARLTQHPAANVRASLFVATQDNPATKQLPDHWIHVDEWPVWIADPASGGSIQVLLYVDEKSSGGLAANYRSVSWCHEFEGGRAFYTALGHTEASFGDDNFRSHLAGGIEWAAAQKLKSKIPSKIETAGLLVDLDPDKGLVLEDGDKVSAWKNQVNNSPSQMFVKRNEGRATIDSGRPTLRRSVPALNGHNALIFRESELVEMNEPANSLLTGSGYTWLVVLAPYTQIGKLQNVNVFLGNLKNGAQYEGFWGGLDDDNTVWVGSRNGITYGRFDGNNPKVMGPRLMRNQYHLIAGRMGMGHGVVPIELFVDRATPSASMPFSVNQDAKPSKLSIGTERDAVNHPGLESFDGEIARVLIYDRPLSDVELARTVNLLKQIYLSEPLK